MILRVINHKFHYEMENLCRVFFSHEKITVIKDNDIKSEEPFMVYTALDVSEPYIVSVHVVSNGKYDEKLSSKVEDYDDCERVMATLLFDLFKKFTGYTPQWGILTGVRPSKLMNALIRDKGIEDAKTYFTDKLLVTQHKAELAYTVANAEAKIMALSDEKSFSLYVSIPFCPTRCNYCSFVSHSIEKAKKLIPEYVERLCDEIRITAEIVRELGLRLESVYWGGGTPTTLNAEQLAKVCAVINTEFDMSSILEYTIEAGRADTVTYDKLKVMKAAGVSRISINPQTFNDDVLVNIGRRHTVNDVLKAYSLARELGFNNINMDLIAGLTGDTYKSFTNSVDRAIELAPENITLHTLALKRSSTIVTGSIDVESGELANKMLEYAQKQFYSNRYKPYYMYRQSRSLGNLENVGWCRDGFECLYNVFMMEECHTVIAVGAGAVTKLKKPYKNVIERVFNFKYPYEYNSQFDTIVERKKILREFYEKL